MLRNRLLIVFPIYVQKINQRDSSRNRQIKKSKTPAVSIKKTCASGVLYKIAIEREKVAAIKTDAFRFILRETVRLFSHCFKPGPTHLFVNSI